MKFKRCWKLYASGTCGDVTCLVIRCVDHNVKGQMCSNLIGGLNDSETMYPLAHECQNCLEPAWRDIGMPHPGLFEKFSKCWCMYFLGDCGHTQTRVVSCVIHQKDGAVCESVIPPLTNFTIELAEPCAECSRQQMAATAAPASSEGSSGRRAEDLVYLA